MKKNNSNKSISKSWIKPIFTLFVIAIPAILIWVFFSNDFFAKELKLEFSWWIKLLISIAFIVVTFFITLLFIYLKILDTSIFIFSLPISFCLMAIFVTDSLPTWARSIIVISFFFLVIPSGIIAKKIENKIKKGKRKEVEKIIGHK